MLRIVENRLTFDSRLDEVIGFPSEEMTEMKVLYENRIKKQLQDFEYETTNQFLKDIDNFTFDKLEEFSKS